MTTATFIIKEFAITKSVNTLKGKSFSSYDLKRELEKNGVPEVFGTTYISQPAASRIVQQLKNKGEIIRVYGGGWRTVWEWKDDIKKREKKQKNGEYTAEQLIILFHNAKKNAAVQRRKERTKWVTVRSSFWEQVARDYLKQIQERVRNHKGEMLKYARKIYGEKIWMQGDVVMINYKRISNGLLTDKRLLSEAGHKVILNKTK